MSDETKDKIVGRSIAPANAAMIGVSGGRGQLLTPALLIELDTLDANIRTMQLRCHQAGVALRPHAKAHKCVEIAKRQVKAGAIGVCVATPGEARIFADKGIPDILVTSTFAPGPALELLADIASQCDLTLVLDRIETARFLAAAAVARNICIPVLIDLDLGRRRSGVSGTTEIAALSSAIDKLEGLHLKGVQAYAGHLSHRHDLGGRTADAQDVARRIQLASEIIRPLIKGRKPIVSGGSTGAFLQELALDVYTELQCGSYALMDVEYDQVDPDGSGQPLFPTSLFVAVRVTSANHAGVATTDGGEKRFAAKHNTAPIIRRGALPGATYKPTSDEHGTVLLGAAERLSVGSAIELQVPHCDPTVNLYDFIHVFRGDTLVDIWPVDARGA